jgi:hypothetical protein
MDFKVVGESERERLLKRQYEIERDMQKRLAFLDKNIQLETSTRMVNQDGITDNMTNFIRAFQMNVLEEGEMG